MYLCTRKLKSITNVFIYEEISVFCIIAHFGSVGQGSDGRS